MQTGEQTNEQMITLSDEKTIRAWKDESYFISLNDEERKALTPHPAGEMKSPIARTPVSWCLGNITC